MKEIKFRGKRLDNNEWAYGYYAYHEDFLRHREIHGIYSDYADSMPESEGYSFYPDFYAVNPETAGQFTGLRDKNGKEIYEGDIIIAGRYDVVEVIFDNGAFQIRYTLNDGSKHQIPFTSLGCKCYVIGNIYDNPELLKGGTL